MYCSSYTGQGAWCEILFPVCFNLCIKSPKNAAQFCWAYGMQVTIDSFLVAPVTELFHAPRSLFSRVLGYGLFFEFLLLVFVKLRCLTTLFVCFSHFVSQMRTISLRSAHTKGLVPATSPGDQVPSCELPIFIKNLVTGTKIWSLRLVPRIQTMFQFVGQVPGTCPRKLCWSLRVNCSWDKSLRPNENKPIADQYFGSQNPSRTPFQDGGRR